MTMTERAATTAETEADWADSVSYNGVSYQKAEDEYGEYYRVASVQDGAVPEETINGLPVKER